MKLWQTLIGQRLPTGQFEIIVIADDAIPLCNGIITY